MSPSMKIHYTGYWVQKNNIPLHHTCCQPLCDWIIDFLKDSKEKQVYDFGCGLGQYLKKLEDAGFTKLTGFEGAIPKAKVFDNIKSHDLSKPLKLPEQGNCIFLEVAEHIPPIFEHIMLDNIVNACNDKLIMSWALRGQAGDGHINCLNNDEAIGKLTKKGMIYLPEETASVRAVIDDSPQETGDLNCPWFKNTLLIFKKKNQ
jgi:SAM-dependent methyltransferase